MAKFLGIESIEQDSITVDVVSKKEFKMITGLNADRKKAPRKFPNWGRVGYGVVGGLRAGK